MPLSHLIAVATRRDASPSDMVVVLLAVDETDEENE